MITEFDEKLQEAIRKIEEARDKDKLCEYPYNRCINILKDTYHVVDATNGDVIQAMFPAAHIFVDTSDDDYQYVYVNYPSAGSSWKIRKEWWDSPYKERDKE